MNFSVNQSAIQIPFHPIRFVSPQSCDKQSMLFKSILHSIAERTNIKNFGLFNIANCLESIKISPIVFHHDNYVEFIVAFFAVFVEDAAELSLGFCFWFFLVGCVGFVCCGVGWIKI